MDKIEWFNYSFLSTNEMELVESLSPGAIFGTGSIHFVNVFTLFCADQDQRLKKILSAEELISDGIPVSYMLRKVSRSAHKQIRGPSFMKQALLFCDKDVRHFLLGSSSETLDLLKKRFIDERPELQIVGTLAPGYFENIDKEIPKWIETISYSSPDVVWVGLGTPKQDYVISSLSNLIEANFIGVGAAFDFLAGTKKEAPLWVQTIAMEWLYRFAQEPKRLWRRYLLGNSHFIAKYALPTFCKLIISKIFQLIGKQ